MLTRIQLRKDISENWNKVNPKLLSGEPGIDSTSRRLKLGDGVHKWKELPYMKIGSQFFDYYVSCDGNDTWDGDEGAPLKTIGKALELAWKNFTYYCNEVEATVSQHELNVNVDSEKVSVGDYFTCNAGYGFISEISDGTATVVGNFDTSEEVLFYTTAKRCTILCTDSVEVTEDVALPPFTEIVNEGLLKVSDGGFKVTDFSMLTFINRGSVICGENVVFISSGDSIANYVKMELGMSKGVTVNLNALRLKVEDTLTPSECNVCGSFDLFEMYGEFVSTLDVSSETAILGGRYSVEGTVEGSVTLNGTCVSHGELTIGKEGKTSVILCHVDGEITKVGNVKDINSL